MKKAMKPLFRESASSGTWCSLLLPMAYLSIVKKNPHSGKDVSSLLLAIFTGLYSFCSAMKLTKTSSQNALDGLREDVILGAFVVVFGAIQLFFVSTFTGIVNCAFLTLYGHALPKVFENYPKSFTFGEGCIVLQTLCIFLANTGAIFSKSTNYYHLTSQLGVVSLIILIFLKKHSGEERWSLLKLSSYGVILLIVFPIPYLWHKFGENPVTWIHNEILEKQSGVRLMIIWTLTTIGAIGVVCFELNSSSMWSKTRLRKIFHLFVTIAVATGILLDHDLTFLATVATFCVQILLEYIRVEQIQPISDYLNLAFKAFLDEKDQGLLVLTNIYLLVGASSPLWLSDVYTQKIALLSGVISVGVGDSAASIIGSKYGKVHWPGSSKTLEGTLACILSQTLFVTLLNELTLGVMLSILIVGLVEAVTDQVDNLVLPILMFAIINLVP